MQMSRVFKKIICLYIKFGASGQQTQWQKYFIPSKKVNFHFTFLV